MKRLLLIMSLSIVLTSCNTTKTEAPKPTPTKVATPTVHNENIKDYFPVTVGSTWEYEGKGSEYASFKRRVMFVKGDRAQIQEDNGGTVSAAIYKTTSEEVTRVFSKPEEYSKANLLDQSDTENSIILKNPIQVGTKWDVINPKAGNITREIVAVDATVETALGKFDNCIKIKISSEQTDANMYEYFKKGIGMVKNEYVGDDFSVSSSLKKYDIKD